MNHWLYGRRGIIFFYFLFRPPFSFVCFRHCIHGGLVGYIKVEKGKKKREPFCFLFCFVLLPHCGWPSPLNVVFGSLVLESLFFFFFEKYISRMFHREFWSRAFRSGILWGLMRDRFAFAEPNLIDRLRPLQSFTHVGKNGGRKGT